MFRRDDEMPSNMTTLWSILLWQPAFVSLHQPWHGGRGLMECILQCKVFEL